MFCLFQLWSLTAKGFNNPRPVWTAAQVTIDTRVPYRLILRGIASNGGFAIDDIKFQPQTCTSKVCFRASEQMYIIFYYFNFLVRPAAAQFVSSGS